MQESLSAEEDDRMTVGWGCMLIVLPLDNNNNEIVMGEKF